MKTCLIVLIERIAKILIVLIIVAGIASTTVCINLITKRPETEKPNIERRKTVTIIQHNSGSGNNVIMTGENAVYYER